MSTKLKFDNENGVIENVADSGDITLRGGDNSIGSGGGGNVVLEGGDGSTTGGAGGAIFIRPGYGPGTPTIPTESGVPQPSEFWFVDANATPGYVGFKAPDNVSAGSTGDGANTVWTLPEGDGTASQVMITDGGGVLSWASIAAAGGVQNPMTANLLVNNFDIKLGDGDSFQISPVNFSAASPASILFRAQTSTIATGGPIVLLAGDSTVGIGGSVSVKGGLADSGTIGGNVFLDGGRGQTGGGMVVLRPGRDSTDGSDDGAVIVTGESAATSAAELHFHEVGDFTSNQYLGLKAPDSVSNSATFEMAVKVQTVTAVGPTAIGEDVDLVVVNASSNAVTITLHSAANERFRPLNVKRIDSTGNTVTVQAGGSDTIDGSVAGGSIVVVGQWTAYTLINDKGTAWYIA